MHLYKRVCPSIRSERVFYNEPIMAENGWKWLGKQSKGCKLIMKSSEMSQNVPKYPLQSSDASLFERTCFQPTWSISVSYTMLAIHITVLISSQRDHFPILRSLLTMPTREVWARIWVKTLPKWVYFSFCFCCFALQLAMFIIILFNLYHYGISSPGRAPKAHVLFF